MKPAYFDLTVTDLPAAKAFFESVFGWTFERFPMPYPYFRIAAGAPGEPGIDGGIGATADTDLTGGMPAVTLTIPVPDIDAIKAKVVAAGGIIVEDRVAIPSVGWYATCAEPGGLRFGLIQADPAVA